MNKKQFRSRRDLSAFLSEQGIDTSHWTEIDWLKLNKGQAEIHMMALAEAMWDARNESIPKQLRAGEWHVPYSEQIDMQKLHEYYITLTTPPEGSMVEFEQQCKIKIATVMAARVSYTVVGEDQKPLTYTRMLEIYDELLNANPKHMSPFEHCSRAMSIEEYTGNIKTEYTHECYGSSEKDGAFCHDSLVTEEKEMGWSGNFKGFIQLRKTIKGENII